MAVLFDDVLLLLNLCVTDRMFAIIQGNIYLNSLSHFNGFRWKWNVVYFVNFKNAFIPKNDFQNTFLTVDTTLSTSSYMIPIIAIKIIFFEDLLT